MMTESKALTVRTTNFGEIEVPVASIIGFDEGIPGFPQIHKFAILEFEHLKPFQYLQSLDDPPIALLVVNPFLLHPAYAFELGDADMCDLKTDKPEEVSVFAVATIPENPSEATLNLMAPILINQKNRCGKQVILLDSQYSVRHPLFGSSERHSAETV
ncbi:MAG: flagellar assembly protein FliW [Acidobacteriia bacterium]|nr:flagellar assembly protein FliW [Terriglobia bacterium]